ncbi:MAG TPA: DUF1801 domain-containing protein [Candidatus Thermoplasmatota archaeon]|nr:DUF1801 domain-containing protein [Candidatus Thermoplasmatota archaeon]
MRAYIAALEGWKRQVAKRFDDLVAREVPQVRRAIKWSAPFYGLDGQGWFAAFSAFTHHVKINFFRGSALKPSPPGGQGKDMRSLDLTEKDAFDDEQIADWIRQAARLPGWGS